MEPKDERELERLKKDKRRAEQKNQLREVAQLCNVIGELLAKYGEWEDAVREHDCELVICESFNDVLGIAIACRKLGECYCELEQHDKALQLQQRHLSLAQSSGNALEEQRAWATIGRTYLYQVDSGQIKASEKARSAFMKSLEVCEKLKDEISIKEYMEMKARLFLNIGLVFEAQKDLNRCVSYMKKAVDIAVNHSLHEDLYRCQFSLARIYVDSSKMNLARECITAAIEAARKKRNKLFERDALLLKFTICFQLADYGCAKHCLKKLRKLNVADEVNKKIIKFYKATQRSESTSKELKNLPKHEVKQRMKLIEELADRAVDVQSYNMAIEYYLKVLESASAAGYPSKDQVLIYMSLAQTYAENQQYELAIRYYKEELACRKGDPEQMCRTLLNLAESQELLQSDYSVVKQTYLEAFQYATETLHQKLQVRTLKSLGLVQVAYGESNDRQETENKLAGLRRQYRMESGDELSDDEYSHSDSDGSDAVSILTESESDTSEDDGLAAEAKTVTGRRTGRQQVKRNEKGETPLHQACIEGNLKKVKKLVEHGQPVNTRDYCGWLPLHEAANHDYCEIVEYLLDHGANIDDQGGEKCGGVTPLIDAASCGNIEVMKLLIDRGARTETKDDNGNSALTCLKDWMVRAKGTFDRELEIESQRMVRMLQERLGVADTPPGRASLISDSATEELPEIVHNSKRRGKKIQNVAPVLSENSQDGHRNGDENDFSENVFVHPEIVKRKDETAAEAYRNAILGVGSSATRVTGEERQCKGTFLAKSSELPAFLDANEVADNWLVEDLRPAKRKRLDMNGLFSTSRTKQKVSAARFETTRHPNSPKGRRHQQPPLSLNDEESQESNLSEKITEYDDCSDLENFDSLDCGIVSPLPQARRQTRVPAETLRQNLTRLTQTGPDIQEYPSTQLVPVSPDLPIIRIYVRIMDTSFCIPLKFCDNSRTISWLSQEAARRVYVQYQLKPLLSLATKSGAVLSPDDEIHMVINNGEEIEGRVDGWDLPPLHHRYSEACRVLNVASYRNIRTLLQSCELSGKLVLENLALRPVHVNPVFRSIKYHHNLRELYLRGNRIGDSGLLALTKMSSTVPHIALLDLSCNDITAIGLKGFTEILKSPSSTDSLRSDSNVAALSGAPLQHLVYLNLSYNPLEDVSSLFMILDRLPALTILCLSSCQLRIRMLEHHQAAVLAAVKASSLHDLDVSCNRCQVAEIGRLMSYLEPSKVLKLDLSWTTQSSIQPLTSHLISYISQTGCVLENISLADCGLCSEDEDLLPLLVSRGRQLKRLDLSYNVKLGNSLLQKVLEKATLLEEVRLKGCGIMSPLGSPLLDALSDKLNSQIPLKKLEFSCCGLNSVDAESLRQVWTAFWKEWTVCDFTAEEVKLAVKHEDLTMPWEPMMIQCR